MNVTLTRYRLGDPIDLSAPRFIRERRPGHRLWFVRIGCYGHTLRIW